MLKPSARLIAFRFVVLVLAALLARCGGGGTSYSQSGGPGPVAAAHAVSGTVTGLSAGATITLTDEGADDLTVAADGAFTFPTPVAEAAAYLVQVSAAPAGETCTVANGSGTMGTSDITNVAITCTPAYTLSGTLSGLGAGNVVVLQYNGGNDLTLAANGAFTFAAPLTDTAPYGVTVLAQPASGACTVVNGSGAIASANVASVQVSCNVVTTFAGSGAAGALDGTGAAASFSGPLGVALDGRANLYVADTLNNKIRRITPQGAVTTLAGSGIAGEKDDNGIAAMFSGPGGVAADASGNVFVADTNNHAIRKIVTVARPGALYGAVSTFAGSGTAGAADGAGRAASFNRPMGVATDAAGNVYVADTGNNLIRKITPQGAVTTLAGSGLAGSTDGAGSAASFNQPRGIAVDAAGNVYIADTGNNLIRSITPAGVVTTLAGSGAAGAADGAGSAATFSGPAGIALDSAGTLYVADQANNKVRIVTPSGAVMTWAGTGAAGAIDGTGIAATFNQPAGVAVDGSGNAFVADSANNLIRAISP